MNIGKIYQKNIYRVNPYIEWDNQKETKVLTNGKYTQR